MVLASCDKIQPDLAQYDPSTGFSATYGYGRINAEKAVRTATLFRKYGKKDSPARGGRRAVVR